MASKRKSQQTIDSEIKRVAIYVRYSNLGGRNKETLTTLDTQESGCRAHCAYKGWEVVKVLADPGRSAFKKNTPRPEYDEALRMIQTGQIDAIVVWKVDRFTRSLHQFTKDWHDIESAGGHFVSVMEQFDTSIPMGRLMLTLVVGFAELESEMKSERAIPMHAFLKENGKVGPGPRPYGYDRTNSKNGEGACLTVNRKEADLLQTAAKWVLDGKSLSSFIHTYQPNSSVANKKMTYHGLRSSLINPTTAGLRTWDESPDGYKEGNWTPIIEREMWNKVVALITDPARRAHLNSTSKSHLLSGLMVCPECNKNVHARGWVSNTTKQRTKRYACPTCYRSVDMAAADPVAVEMLFDAVPESKWQAWQSAGTGWDIDVIKGYEAKLALIDKQYSDDIIGDDRWMTMTADIQAKIDSANNSEPLDIPMIPHLRNGWDELSLHDKQRVFRQAFASIHILPAKGAERFNVRTRIAMNER